MVHRPLRGNSCKILLHMNKFLLNLAAWAARVLPQPLKTSLYKVKPLARFIRGSLNRAAPTGIVPVKVAGGDLAGCTILLDMQIDKDYWLGTYEPELQRTVRELVRPGQVVYDVGANIGYLTLLLARASGEAGRVYAFEALPENAERWRRNIELNGLASRACLFAGAVTEAAGPVTFLVHTSAGMGKVAGSGGRADAVQAEITVEGISLDEFIYARGNPAPQVIKMDIEGGEVLALPGMNRLLSEARPLLLLELHGADSCQAAWEYLTTAGYRLAWMQPHYPAIASLEAMGVKAYIVAFPPGNP